MACLHVDVRSFEGLSTCLACGDTTFEPPAPSQVVIPPDSWPVESHCRHTDFRTFDQGRICLACGEPEHETKPGVKPERPEHELLNLEEIYRNECRHPDIRKLSDYRTCLACGETVFERSSSTDSHVAAGGPSHVYHRLNYALGQEIRLINLLPGEPSDPVRCQMLHVNLQDDPAYEAVSYTWATEDGDDSLSKAVYFVDSEQAAPVTENCEAALRQLRKRGCSRRLWVDAICIDQTNVNERNHQVGLMYNIFSKAWRVLICLQDDGFDAEQAYTELFSILRNDGDLEPCVLPTVQRLLSRRYFQRVWVIQEIALARSAYLLVNEHVLHLCKDTLATFERICSNHGFAVPEVLKWIPGRPDWNIFTCLASGAHCQATDPRDRIFALLSLMEPRARAMIPLDYSLSVRCVETYALTAIIVVTGSLEHLRFLSGCAGLPLGYLSMQLFRLSPQFSGSESIRWQPTVSVNIVERMAREPLPPDVDAPWPITIEKPSSFNVAPRLQRMRTRAHFIDTIKVASFYTLFPYTVLTTTKRAESPVDVDHLGSWHYRSRSRRFLLKAWKLVEELKREPLLLLTRHKWMLDYFRTTLEVQGELGAFWWKKPKFLQDKDLPFVNMESLRAFLEAVEHRLALYHSHRVSGEAPLIFATHFSLGCAAPGFRKGDQIWAVDGVSVPLVLRKAGSEYRLVGECYLWAALDLDRWNPGTKKGRWLHSYEDSPEQTRLIVLHGTADG
jgi:hypothetical protein